LDHKPENSDGQSDRFSGLQKALKSGLEDDSQLSRIDAKFSWLPLCQRSKEFKLGYISIV
jgi:hypothetical protein